MEKEENKQQEENTSNITLKKLLELTSYEPNGYDSDNPDHEAQQEKLQSLLPIFLHLVKSNSAYRESILKEFHELCCNATHC